MANESRSKTIYLPCQTAIFPAFLETYAWDIELGGPTSQSILLDICVCGSDKQGPQGVLSSGGSGGMMQVLTVVATVMLMAATSAGCDRQLMSPHQVSCLK